jgi:hypothetical protein
MIAALVRTVFAQPDADTARTQLRAVVDQRTPTRLRSPNGWSQIASKGCTHVGSSTDFNSTGRTPQPLAAQGPSRRRPATHDRVGWGTCIIFGS